MMAQDLTKFTIVIVILGVALALAIFRPPLLTAAPGPIDDDSMPMTNPSGSDPVPGDEPPTDGYCPDQAKLAAWESALDEREEELERGEARLTEQARALQDKEDLLAKQLDDIQVEREHLDNEWERLREKETFLQSRETSVAEREQKVQGLHRLSLVALVVSGIMGLPSIALLVTLLQQDQRASGKAVKQTKAPRIEHREQVARPVAPTPIHGDNGRCKETELFYVEGIEK